MSVNKKPVVIGIGELLWDMLPEGKRAGGAPINFVYHATQLGADGYAVSAVGNDIAGDEILAELEKSNIKGIIERNNYPTGIVEVSLKDGMPSYKIVEGAAWDHINVTDEAIEIMEQADAVCFGTLALRHKHSAHTIKELLQYTPKSCFRLFDINLRENYYSAPLIDELLTIANIFKINIEEMETISKFFDVRGSNGDICRFLIKKYKLKYLIFTAGEKYSIIYSGRKKSYLKTPQVKVYDTIGAGDSFSAAFVYNILTGKNLTEAHRAAAKISAFVCTRSGAWPQYDEGGFNE